MPTAKDIIIIRENAAGTGKEEVVLPDVANTLAGFDSSGNPVTRSAGAGISITDTEISSSGGGSVSLDDLWMYNGF